LGILFIAKGKNRMALKIKNNTFKLLLFLLGLILSSCFALIPERKSKIPAVQLPNTWQTPYLEAIKKSSHRLWWEEYSTPPLRKLIKKALLNSRFLLAEREKVLQASYILKQASSTLFPHLSGDLNASRTQRKFVGFPIPGQEQKVLGTLSSSFGLGLNVSWEIDLWGKNLLRRKAALENAKAASYLYQATINSFVAQVMKSYFAAALSKRKINIEKKKIRAALELLTLLEFSYQKGLVPLSAVLNQKEVVLSLKQKKNNLELNFRNNLRAIKTLVSEYPTTKVKIRYNFFKTLPKLSVGIPLQVLSKRPDIAAARESLLSASHSLTAEKLELLPSINILGSTGTFTNKFEQLTNGDFSVWSLASNITQPLFQGGAIKAKILLEKSKFKQQLYLYVEKVYQAAKEVESAIEGEYYLYKTEKEALKRFKTAKAIYKLSNLKYKKGLISKDELLKEEINMLNLKEA
ncbi:MAG: TolC family protein, partial [Candidatus Dadabacteria bacterium]